MIGEGCCPFIQKQTKTMYARRGVEHPRSSEWATLPESPQVINLKALGHSTMPSPFGVL